MPAGRPTLYTPELLAKAREYVEGGWVDEGDAVPTVVGLAIHIGITKATCYAWQGEEGKEEFSDILTRVMDIQERGLVNGGLAQGFAPLITKMMLTKHGYADQVETKNFNVTIEGDDAKL